MLRQCTNERGAFPKSIEAYTSKIEPKLHQRRAELDKGWEELEKGWKEIEERRVEIGVRPRTNEEGMVAVNIGGWTTRLRVSLLAEAGLFDDGNALGGLLEGIFEESTGIPRDAAGCIVLDESVISLKHIIQPMLNRVSSSVKATGSERGGCSANEARHLIYTSYVLGTWQAMPTDTHYTILKGGSTMLTALELLPMGAVLRQLCFTPTLNLIYRASRDGFDAKSFRARCSKEFPNTITLIRVRCGGAAGDSIVGGYSTAPWAGIPINGSSSSAGAFIFMLRDGSCAHPNIFTPVRWTLKEQKRVASYAVRAPPNSGPCFGEKDLRTNFKEGGGGTIQTASVYYSVNSAKFLGLGGKEIVDIEVFGVCSDQNLAGNGPKLPGGAAFSKVTAGDVRLFGEVIAASLAEERAALQHAFKLMKEAEARVTAASHALQTVYGLDLDEANKKGFVVELNVRGTTMATLRSTLQACTESALAARFDEDKWPVLQTDCDEQGRRLIDCRPSVFSKVLDALRMRKRESWSLNKAEKETGRSTRGTAQQAVVVEERDRACFEEFVDMYFPGCQSFITDLAVFAAAPAQGAPNQSSSGVYFGGSVDVDSTSFGDYW